MVFRRPDGRTKVCRVCGEHAPRKGICKTCDAKTRKEARHARGLKAQGKKATACPKCGGWEKKKNKTGQILGCLPCIKEKARNAMRAARDKDREQYNASQRTWHRSHPDYHRAGSLKKNFGITIEQYDKMAAFQDNACAICRGHNPSGKRLAVDHDHTSGKIRSLLCSRCNTALGQLREQPGLCRAAAEYLERWQSE